MAVLLISLVWGAAAVPRWLRAVLISAAAGAWLGLLVPLIPGWYLVGFYVWASSITALAVFILLFKLIVKTHATTA